uniref:CD3 gamma/delta subunit Ig-like domain-containing protein n=1 Tax=Bubo bubo TaxID=30461 RepID=A0A8C0FAC9_BUBBB
WGRGSESGRCSLLSFLFTGQNVVVKEASGKVFLQCEAANQGQVIWLKDGNAVGNTTQLDLGAVYDDPRGVYTCRPEGGKESPPLQVHYRMCQNCIEVDAPTISGIVIADVVATVFLAVAVYCITGQDKGRMSRGEGRAGCPWVGMGSTWASVGAVCTRGLSIAARRAQSLQAAGSSQHTACLG